MQAFPDIDADMIFHNTFFKRALSGMFLLLAAILPLQAGVKASQAEADKKHASLYQAKSNSDSIKILIDVYNLSDKNQRDKVRRQLINLAAKSNNHEVISDVISELASSTDDASQLDRLIEISENLPEDSSRSSLQTMLQMEQAQMQASDVADSQLQQHMAEYASSGMAISGDPYKEIQNIYRILTYLGASSQGPLYFEYIQRLGELVDALPEEDHAIKNLYYTTAAIAYTRKRDYKKAIEYDRKLLSQLDELQQRYTASGDTTHKLDYFYYVDYRRMLRNFKGLTPEEVQQYYDRCLQLAAENEQVAQEFGNGGLTNSYYYMATEQFSKAIPELKKALNSDKISKYRRRELLGHLAYAYRQVGDAKGELETLRPYTQLLLEDREERLNDMYREIELRNSVNKIIQDEYNAQQKQREENGVMRKTSITLVYVLAVILIFLCQAYFRLRQKMKEVELRNNKLRKNIEDIFDDGVPKGSKDLRHQKNRLKG